MTATCPMCGELLRQQDSNCTVCAVSTATQDSLDVIAAGQSFAYRLGRSIAMAAGAALAGALALAVTLGVLALLPYVFNGTILPVVQAAVMLGGIFMAVIGFSGFIVSFAEMRRSASLELSEDMLRFDDLHGGREIGLAEIRGVRVVQGLLGSAFGYGTIEIFSGLSSEPAAVIPGIRRPHSFKESLELVLEHHGAERR